MHEALTEETSAPETDPDLLTLKARYAGVFAHLTDGVVVQDRYGHVVEVNQAARGYDVWTTRWAHGTVHGAGWNHPDHPAMAVLRSGTPRERLSVVLPPTACRPERRLRVTLLPLRREDGEVFGVLSLLNDETERHARDEALRRGEEHFRLAIEHTSTGFAVVDLQGRVVRSNGSLARYLGVPADNLVGQALHRFVHPDDLDDVADQARSVIAGHQAAVEADLRWVRADGDIVWGHVSGAISGPADGEQNLVVQVHDTTHHRRAQDLLAHMALHDPLTGQPNRILVLDRIQKALERARRRGHFVAVLVSDVDRFKTVNDSLGHEVGDSVLIEIARRVSGSLRGGDTAGRLGGDEFVVVCEDVVDEREAITVAERLLQEIRTPIVAAGRGVIPTVSIGIAVSNAADADPESMLRDAGTAMHRAKESGRNTWEISDPEMSRRATDRLDLEHALRESILRGELSLHFQPIVDLASPVARTVGHEALLRWRHPLRGLLNPADFLQVAEDSGQIIDIGRWVIKQAAAVAAAAGPAAGYVSVNVSALQLARPGLLGTVRTALEDSGLPPDRLVLELTESVMLSAAPSARRELTQLDDLGTRIVVDDFGTGFSALSYLRDLPIRGIKIDRSFTSGLGASHHCERIVEAVNALGRGLGVDVVVEGVETTAQRSVLQEIGAAHAQGFLFGRPRPRLAAA